MSARAVLVLAALLAIPASSFAQQPATGAGGAPAASGPGNAAVNRSDQHDQQPVAGANSFTEGQAKSRIENHGFSNVTDLKKDANGVWRATAMKDGKSTTVSLDFKGNVVASQ